MVFGFFNSPQKRLIRDLNAQVKIDISNDLNDLAFRIKQCEERNGNCSALKRMQQQKRNELKRLDK